MTGFVVTPSAAESVVVLEADGFVARHGLVKYRPTLGRKYSRDGLCEVCGSPPRIGLFLLFDHCHAHGWVRGLICKYCNDALGFFENGHTEYPYYIELLAEFTAYRRNCPDCGRETKSTEPGSTFEGAGRSVRDIIRALPSMT